AFFSAAVSHSTPVAGRSGAMTSLARSLVMSFLARISAAVRLKSLFGSQVVMIVAACFANSILAGSSTASPCSWLVLGAGAVGLAVVGATLGMLLASVSLLAGVHPATPVTSPAARARVRILGCF